MKYKFSIPTRTRNMIEMLLEHYPVDKRELDHYKTDMIPSPTQGYSLTAGVDGGDVGRSTEQVAMRIISSPYVRRLEINCTAIENALSAVDDIDRKLVDLIYWKKEYTAVGAGIKLHLSSSATYKRLNKIIGLIAYEMGYVRE